MSLHRNDESNRVYSKRLSQRRKEKIEKDYCYPISLGLHLYASGMSKTSRGGQERQVCDAMSIVTTEQ